jgi:hypothetical protein
VTEWQFKPVAEIPVDTKWILRYVTEVHVQWRHLYGYSNKQLAKEGLQYDKMSKRSACQNNKNDRAQRSYKERDKHHGLLEERRDLECVAHETGDENHTPSREQFECEGEDLTLRPKSRR